MQPTNLISLDMFGFVDDVMTTGAITRIYRENGSYVDGIWQDGIVNASRHVATVQPLSPVEAQNIDIGGNRIKDYRKIYINDGTMAVISPQDEWVIDSINYKTVDIDNRPSRNYCKITVFRMDT